MCFMLPSTSLVNLVDLLNKDIVHSKTTQLLNKKQLYYTQYSNINIVTISLYGNSFRHMYRRQLPQRPVEGERREVGPWRDRVRANSSSARSCSSCCLRTSSSLMLS